MIIRAFRSVRAWEKRRQIAGMYSPAYGLFGFLLPTLIYFSIAPYFEIQITALHPNLFVYLYFAGCAVSMIFLIFFDDWR